MKASFDDRIGIDLLPCPFCGCETASLIDERSVVLFKDIFAARHCVIECDNCGAKGEGAMCQSKQYQDFDDLPKRAIEKWNNRINATDTWIPHGEGISERFITVSIQASSRETWPGK